jgi:hypothetical protein
MPNWCYTDYVIEGDTKEVADLHQKLTGLLEREESLAENGFGKNWLGNVAELFGKSWHEIKCRGTFYDLRLENGCICFTTETAWADCYELWVFVCGQYKTLRFYYRAEESGCCYYVTNDDEGKYFPERYMLDINGEEVCHFETDEEVIKKVSETVEREFRNILEVKMYLHKYNELHPDDCIYLNEYDVVDRSLSKSLNESADEL